MKFKETKAIVYWWTRKAEGDSSVLVRKASAIPRGRKQATNVNCNHSAVETASVSRYVQFICFVWLLNIVI